MTKVAFHKPSQIPDDLLKYAVVAARYEDKWIFCRHKKRDTWEIPGGHREKGETIDETARRELYEETGAVDASINTVAVYSVEKDGNVTYGSVFYADVKSMSTLPCDSEIGEAVLFETLPGALTYPDIQRDLFYGVQGWINTQNSSNELWDVYDENRNLTGKLHRRGTPLEEGDYHLVVHVWLQNSRGEFLLTKRTSNKGFPNMWETTGGSALAGDDSITAAMREVKEETGLTVDPSRGERIISFKRDDNFVDVWLFNQDFELDDVVLLEGETCDKMYADTKKIRALYDEGMFVPFSYLDQILDMSSN